MTTVHAHLDIPILPLEQDAAVEAIQFALNNDEGLAFLRCWIEGNFQAIRDEWPEAPEEVFIGADPLHRKEPEKALTHNVAGYMHASGNLNALPDLDAGRRYLVLETNTNPAMHYQSADPALAHCPFCGQQDAFVEQLDSDASVVVCQGRISEHSACLARGPVGVQQNDCEDQPGHDNAVEQWNRRSVEQHQNNMVGTKFRLVSHPNGHEWVVKVGDKHHSAALRANHLSIATLYTATAPETVIVNKLDIALAEFLRGKMKRLHTSYSLAFEAGWHAHNPSEIELCYEHALKSIQAEADRLRSEVKTMHKDADRYRWLRSRDLNTIHDGGVFAGLTPANLIVNKEDLDYAVDAAMAKAVKP